MTSVIRTERVLSIGVARSEKIDEVHVNEEDKPLFDDTQDEEEDEDILFPELVHGQDARLEGRLIRGNEASNTAGLEYQGHVINCVPAHGSVRQYKAALFLRCKVEGRITRHAKSRFVADRRPTLMGLSVFLCVRRLGELVLGCCFLSSGPCQAAGGTPRLGHVLMAQPLIERHWLAP
jgi:hypothetical protein